jgi:hypothetical protein
MEVQFFIVFKYIYLHDTLGHLFITSAFHLNNNLKLSSHLPYSSTKAFSLLRQTLSCEIVTLWPQNTISYDKVWRGKEKSLVELYGKCVESFELLFRWKAEVMKRFTRSVMEIDVFENDEELYFHHFLCS